MTWPEMSIQQFDTAAFAHSRKLCPERVDIVSVIARQDEGTKAGRMQVAPVACVSAWSGARKVCGMI
jgi:hypothetical protein